MVRSKTIPDIKKTLRHVTQIQLAYFLHIHVNVSRLTPRYEARNISRMCCKYSGLLSKRN